MTARRLTLTDGPGAGPFYVIPMSPDTYRSLAWIADRYTSAAVLYDGATHRPNVLIIPEPVAAAYLAELPQDNGNPYQLVPPCAGGPLADALADLYTLADEHGIAPDEHEAHRLAGHPIEENAPC